MRVLSHVRFLTGLNNNRLGNLRVTLALDEAKEEVQHQAQHKQHPKNPRTVMVEAKWEIHRD